MKDQAFYKLQQSDKKSLEQKGVSRASSKAVIKPNMQITVFPGL